mgnify:CR=1 FL=1
MAKKPNFLILDEPTERVPTDFDAWEHVEGVSFAAQSAAYAAAVREGEAREQQRVEGVLAAQTAVHAAARESEAQERQQLQAALAAQTEDVRRMHEEISQICA